MIFRSIITRPIGAIDGVFRKRAVAAATIPCTYKRVLASGTRKRFRGVIVVGKLSELMAGKRDAKHETIVNKFVPDGTVQ